MSDTYTFYKNIKNSYKKNLPELFGLWNKYYPDFVYEKKYEHIKNEIPVFTLHSVEYDKFNEQLQFLSKNGYQTLTADHLFECVIGSKEIPDRAIVLTFDDGCESIWRVAYPLLKKYGYHAVSFIIPGLIIENISYYPNLEDLWNGLAKAEDVSGRIGNRDPLCTWAEIQRMHESGVIDFQSHTMYHSLIFTSPVIDDFMNPSFECYMKNFNVPLFQDAGIDNIERNADLGMLIYKNEPRFSDKLRYFDDEELRKKCVDYVRINGGESYFKKKNWRKGLLGIVGEYRNKYGELGHYESEEEQKEILYKDLCESKQTIEEKLSGKIVNHICYPWWVGSDLSIKISKKAGYLTNFWGMVPERRSRNRIGDDPYRVSRLLGDEFIFRLPGVGRKSLLEIIEKKITLNYKGFIKKLF